MTQVNTPTFDMWAASFERQAGAVELAVMATAALFMIGLLTGLWKYLAIARSPQARAPYYVDIAHRTSLMYAYSALLVAVLAGFSPWSVALTWWSTLGPLVFFFAAIATYVIHGWLNDTRNQLAKPHVLGRWHLPGWMIHGFMGVLALVEIAGIGVLVAGVFCRFLG